MRFWYVGLLCYGGGFDVVYSCWLLRVFGLFVLS